MQNANCKRAVTLVFLRYERAEVTNIGLLTLRTALDSTEDVKKALVSATTHWVNTSAEGQSLWEDSSQDLNIGDLAGSSAFENAGFLQSLQANGLEYVDCCVSSTDEVLGYDDVLVDADAVGEARELQEDASQVDGQALRDGEVLGLDTDGHIIQWDAKQRAEYNSGTTVEDFGRDNLSTEEAQRLSTPAATAVSSEKPAELADWETNHSAAAMREGWNIFECDGSANGRWQIQRLDDASDVPGAPQLETDVQAWDLVLRGDEPHHRAALAFLRTHNPAEYEVLMAHAEAEDIAVVGLTL